MGKETVLALSKNRGTVVLAVRSTSVESYDLDKQEKLREATFKMLT